MKNPKIFGLDVLSAGILVTTEVSINSPADPDGNFILEV